MILKLIKLKGDDLALKKASILFALIAVLTLSGCSNTNIPNKATSSERTSSQSQKGFSGKTFKNDDGSITITKVETTKTTNPAVEGEIKAVLVVGKFTNNSSESQSPRDFLAQYIKVYGVGKNSDSDLGVGGLSINTPYDDLYDASSDKVHPGKTIEFMLGYQVDNLSSKYKLVARTKSLDELKPALTLDAKRIDVSDLNKSNDTLSTSTTSSDQESLAQTENTSSSSDSSNSSQESSNSNNELPPFDGTLTDFVNKYGVTPVVYKVQHFGMSPKEALESTPDELQTSGEIQTEAGY